MTASENHPERRWIERLLGRLGRGVAAEIQALGEVGRSRERQGEAGRGRAPTSAKQLPRTRSSRKHLPLITLDVSDPVI